MEKPNLKVMYMDKLLEFNKKVAGKFSLQECLADSSEYNLTLLKSAAENLNPNRKGQRGGSNTAYQLLIITDLLERILRRIDNLDERLQHLENNYTHSNANKEVVE